MSLIGSVRKQRETAAAEAKKPPKLISAKEVAQMLGIKENTVHNCGGGTGRLKRVRFGRRILYLYDEVIELIETQIARA
jgi:hypothetical protein